MSDEASMTVCVVVALLALAVMMLAAEMFARSMRRYEANGGTTASGFPPGVVWLMLGVAALLFFVMGVWGAGQRL